MMNMKKNLGLIAEKEGLEKSLKKLTESTEKFKSTYEEMRLGVNVSIPQESIRNKEILSAPLVVTKEDHKIGQQVTLLQNVYF